MKTNKTFLRLCELPKSIFSYSNLDSSARAKVKETAQYALDHNNETDVRAVFVRCAIAILAEQLVAKWLNGHVMSGDEDTSDPYTYAFDVLAGPEYYGMRIEVKTQQSNAKWVSVNTGTAEPYPGDTGLNLRPFYGMWDCGFNHCV